MIIFYIFYIFYNNYDNNGEDEGSNRQAKAELKSQKNIRDLDKLENVRTRLSPQQQKILEATTEKGASSWLNTLPLRSHNFYLNK